MPIILPPFIESLLNRFTQNGAEAYVVGGCIRDSLRGETPHDWDVATSALPEQTMAMFSDCTVIPTGLQHGTVTVLWHDMPVEITTYRVDGAYSDSRRPDSVQFTRSLTEDLRRRDFTINALAYHPAHGLVDPFGGQADLENRCIRCVGDADTRFTEDALRILRALRFSSVLGFSIEQETARSLVRLHARLDAVAPERIASELTKLLCGENVCEVLLDYAPVITQLLPELAPAVGFAQNSPYHCYDVYTHIAHSVAAVPADPILRWTMLLHDSGKPACYTQDQRGVGHFHGHAAVSEPYAETVLRRLRMDNATLTAVCELVRLHDVPIEPTERVVLRWLNRIGEERLRQLLLVKAADCAAQAPHVRDRLELLPRISALIEQIKASHSCFSLRTLAVNGNDLLARGAPAGKPVGELLERLLDAVISGQRPNEKSALLALADQWICQMQK